MIRSSALLTAGAMAMLVAGVSSASLRLIYASIAVSILAAITLGAGVLLRRRELFGAAGAGDTGPGWAAAEARARSAGDPAAEAPRPVGAGRAARAGHGGKGDGGRGDSGRDDGDKSGGPAERLRKAASGGAAAGSGRWPGAIAAKGGPLAARGGHTAGHAAGRGRSAKSAPGAEPAATDRAAHAPAPREPARGDWTSTERDRPGREADTAAWQAGDHELASRGRGDRAAAGREPAGSGRDQQRGGRDRDQRERDQAAARGNRDREGDRAAWADREAPGRGRDRDRDRGAAARADRDQAGRPDREQAGRPDREPAAWADQDQAAHGRDGEQAAAGQQAGAFRLPPSPGERTARARSETARPGPSGEPRTGDDFWDRVSDELTGGRSQDPVRPAWPATAGPRAMGAGAAAKAGSAGTGDDEAEPAWSSSGPAGIPPWDRRETPWSSGRPDEGPDEDERPVGERDESRWSRMVPRYVDDLARPGQGREPAGTGRTPGSSEAPGEDGAPAETAPGTTGPGAGSVWNAWSARTPGPEDQPAAAFRDVRERGGEGGSPEDGRAGRHAIDGGAAPGGDADEEETGAEDRETDLAGDGQTAAMTAGHAAAQGPAAQEAGARGATTTDGTDEAAAGQPEARETGPDEVGTDKAGTDVAEAYGTPAAEASDQDAGGAGPAGDARDAGADAAAGVPDSTADDDTAGPAQGTGEPDDTGKADRAGDAASAATAGDGADGRQDPDAPRADDAEDAGRAAAADGAGSSPLDEEVTIVPGVARYHRRGCILIRFLSDGDLEAMPRREAEATGSVPCKACQPDKPDPSA